MTRDEVKVLQASHRVWYLMYHGHIENERGHQRAVAIYVRKVSGSQVTQIKGIDNNVDTWLLRVPFSLAVAAKLCDSMVL